MAFKEAMSNAKKKAKGDKGSKKGGGFKAAVENVKKGGKGKYDDESASAIVASASRNASPAAKKKNPSLKKVK